MVDELAKLERIEKEEHVIQLFDKFSERVDYIRELEFEREERGMEHVSLGRMVELLDIMNEQGDVLEIIKDLVQSYHHNNKLCYVIVQSCRSFLSETELARIEFQKSTENTKFFEDRCKIESIWTEFNFVLNMFDEQQLLHKYS